MLGLKYPLVFLGPSPRWDFHAFGHSGSWAGSSRGRCGALPPVSQGLVATAGLGYRPRGCMGCTRHCLARGRPDLSLPHTWKVSSEQSFQSLTPAQKYVSVMRCVLIISSSPRIWFWQSELWDAWHYFPASLDNKLIKLFHCVTVFFFRKLWLVEDWFGLCIR